jgi:hypothetical protein
MTYFKQGSISIISGYGKPFRVYFNIHYRILKTTKKYPILNDRFMLQKCKDSQEEIVTFGQPHDDITFCGLKPMNHVIRYKTEEEAIENLKGLILIPDKQYALKRKRELELELEHLKKFYKI